MLTLAEPRGCWETQSNDSQKQRPEPAPLPGGYSSRVSALALGTWPPGRGQTHRRPSGAGQGAPAWESLSPGPGLSGQNRTIRKAEVRGRPSDVTVERDPQAPRSRPPALENGSITRTDVSPGALSGKTPCTTSRGCRPAATPLSTRLSGSSHLATRLLEEVPVSPRRLHPAGRFPESALLSLVPKPSSALRLHHASHLSLS